VGCVLARLRRVLLVHRDAAVTDNLFGIIVASLVSPAILYIIQQWYARRKNKADYGDDLLDIINKTTASLKQARADLSGLELEMRKADQEHADEMSTLEKTWRERQDRMRARVVELEKIIVKYDISFTLTTHPQVQVTDLKVISKEDVNASQKMSAVKDGGKQ
jgi:hypothetical protein